MVFETGITRPRYPAEDPEVRAQIQSALKTYEQLLDRQDWLEAILHYRLHLHDYLVQQMDFREVLNRLQPFFDPDFTRVIHPLNENVQAFLCLNAARCLAALGYPHPADGLILAHNRLRLKSGDAVHHAWGLLDLVRLTQFPARKLDEAAANLAQVLKLARKQNFPSLLAAAYLAQARLHLLKPEPDAAAAYLALAERISRSSLDFVRLTQVYAGWSQWELQNRQPFAALIYSSKAIRLATRLKPRTILQAQIAYSQTLVAALTQSGEDPTIHEIYPEARHTLNQALKQADQHSLAFELLDAATEALRLAWWDSQTAPNLHPSLKSELVPFTQHLIQFAEQIAWQQKLSELHELLVQFG